MEKVSERIPTGNNYPIKMSTIYPGIWIEVHNDFELINALDNKGNVARSLLVRKFFPDASPEEVREVVRSLSLTGINADEYGKVEEYAARKRSIRLQEDIIAGQKKIYAKAEQIAENVKGVPAMAEESRDETVKASRLTEAIIKTMGGFSQEERIVYFDNANGKTQTGIAKKLKCSIDHVRYLARKINQKLQFVGRPKMLWNNSRQRRDRSRPIEEYSGDEIE